jgi:hypothetical protein
MKDFHDKVDDAVHAAFGALGLSVPNHQKRAEALNDYITDMAREIGVTDDGDEGEEDEE